jgi:polyribonucleotide nucleotidyltransferase
MKKQSLNRKKFETEINGEKLTFEISDMALQANGAVMGTYGETVVLVTATMNDRPSDMPFFPLTVDYEERFYAIGKILGSRFMRREGRPSTEATLSARLIDRSIRPLFDERMRNPIQVVVTVLSYDEEHDPDIVALISASLALGISDIPWDGPVAAFKPIKGSIFAGIKDRINMIEFGDKEVSEGQAEKYFDESLKEVNRLVEFQEKIIKEIGKEKKKMDFPEVSEGVEKFIDKIISEKIEKAFENGEVDNLSEELDKYLEENEIEEKDIAYYTLENKIKDYVVRKAIDEKKRVDGRTIDEIRPLYSEVGLFKRTHGSGLFMRGKTHLLAVTTTAPPGSEQLVETIELSGSKRFLLHYNFPSFSVGEAGRAKSPGRREIGHGALAQKAIEPFIPSKESFPYTIRVVAETMSSNGSSSMATVCATSLSLMDAGVPIKSHVAGIAMGLMYDEKTKEYEILTDIQGPEDHYGGMDLKVAGTRNGINAIQMDVKVDGLTLEMFKKGLVQAKKARLEIIENMEEVISEPRKNLSPYAPTIFIHKVKEDQIGEIIGPGGKTINNISDTAGNDTTIDIDDDGTVYISSPDKESAEKALEMVKAITKKYEVGEIVEGTIINILDFGAIVDLGGGASGMIHVSELADKYVEKVTDVVEVGEKVKAKVIKVESGKIGLSLKGMKDSK